MAQQKKEKKRDKMKKHKSAWNTRDIETSVVADQASIQMFLGYGSSLIQKNKFKEAISVYSICAQMATLSMDIIKDLSSALIDFYLSRTVNKSNNTDSWSCCMCASILVEPVTISCGHTVCKKCLVKDVDGLCKKCGTKYEAIDPDPIDLDANIKVTVLVCELVSKFWDKELRAVQLRNEGNKYFSRGDIENSLHKYSEAFKLSPKDHFITSNRSHAYYMAEKFQEALDDANLTISTKPDWGKGYFRRGMCLTAMGNSEGALEAFFQCLVLEQNCSQALRAEINKVLYNLVSLKHDVELEDMRDAGPSIESGEYQETELGGNRLDAAESSESEDSDSEAESEDTTITLTKLKATKKMLISKNRTLCVLLDRINESTAAVIWNPCNQPPRDINPSAVKTDDFDCSLCFRLMWEPVTTPCGHTYCKACIDRSLDHKRECPLCKTTLAYHHSVKMATNEFVEETIRRMLPVEFAERQKMFEDEMVELTGNPLQDGSLTIPIFVCTMSFPQIPCPLHVFEPRYRLMIRRTMEAGTREFGMCTNSGDPDKPFSDYGTMLEIRDIQYFPDGRSVVDTMGGRRFKVINRGMKDGYDVASVEFLKDCPVEESELAELQSLHDRTKMAAQSWFNAHDADMKTGILSHYGSMPAVEEHYWSLPSGPAWAWWVLAILPLDSQAQQQILCHVHLKKRLEAIGRIIAFLVRRNSNV